MAYDDASLQSSNNYSDPGWQDERCTSLALGFAYMSESTGFLLLISFNCILVFINTLTFAGKKHNRTGKVSRLSASNGENEDTVALASAETAATSAPRKGDGLRNGTKASRISSFRKSNEDAGKPLNPPPTYSPHADIGSESQRSSAPLPVSLPTRPAPETRAVVNATLLLIFHLLVTIIGGFTLSRLLYCPPEAPVPTFVQALLWVVYAAHATFLVMRLARWLETFGKLYPDNRQPRWARADGVLWVLWLPTLPLKAAYWWFTGRIERLRVRLGEETSEGVGLEEIIRERGRLAKGGYQRVRGEEVDVGQDRG